MKMDRKAVTDLPIKLLVISIILSVSVPIIAGAADVGERNMDLAQMENEAGRIGNTVGTVYYSQNGYACCVDVDIPDGCRLIIGGEGNDSYGIRMIRGTETVGTHWMEKPMVRFAGQVEVSGHATLKVEMRSGGAAEVSLV